MADIEVLLPKMGESVVEGTITEWLVEEGSKVEEDDFIVNIATDKVDNEVPSPASGTIKIVRQKDETVQVGEVIALISTDVEGVVESAPKNAPAESVGHQVVDTTPAPIENGNISAVGNITSTSDRFYSPLVKNIAHKEGIEVAELDQIPGSGKNGRVTKKDILAYLANRQDRAVTTTKTASNTAVQPPKAAQKPTTKPVKAPSAAVDGNTEIIEMDRMRKLIADHMVKSVQVAPHVTSFVEADVTNMVLWRERIKKQFQDREGEKITFTPILLEAVVKALKDFPLVNSSIDGDRILVKKDINVGMATALPSGNLIVPVIKNADQYNLTGLVKQVNSLALKARNNTLSPEDIQGGTYTISNVGTFGNVMGTPIINQPQSAILALGAIRKKPAVIETEYGDTIGIRHMMFMSHSYDHRNIDGALGGSFVKRVADYLEQFDLNREL